MQRYLSVNEGGGDPRLLSYQLATAHPAIYDDRQPFQVMKQGELSPEIRSLVEAVVDSVLNDRFRTGIRILVPTGESLVTATSCIQRIQRLPDTGALLPCDLSHSQATHLRFANSIPIAVV